MNTIKNTLVENLATQGQEKLSINGIKDKYIRENMKKLMENQIRQAYAMEGTPVKMVIRQKGEDL